MTSPIPSNPIRFHPKVKRLLQFWCSSVCERPGDRFSRCCWEKFVEILLSVDKICTTSSNMSSIYCWPYIDYVSGCMFQLRLHLDFYKLFFSSYFFAVSSVKYDVPPLNNCDTRFDLWQSRCELFLQRLKWMMLLINSVTKIQSLGLMRRIENIVRPWLKFSFIFQIIFCKIVCRRTMQLLYGSS